MNLLKTLLLCTLLSTAVAACGQKGPLYLPEDGAGQPPADSQQDEDDENGA
jgi:predicted small lipoprotein YifL